MRHLFRILQELYEIFKVRFDIISDSGTAVDLADKILQTSGKCPEPNDWELYYGISGQWKLYDDGITAKFMV
jgi:hypothetical protein